MKYKDEMVAALKKEIQLRANDLHNTTIKSLYLGGGTPSVLSVDEIKSLLDEVLHHFDFHEEIEITLEANPDDLKAVFLKNLSQTPINRLSIGTQSFYDEDLKLMNRAHNASDAESSIKRAQDFGFENLSIDLIYGSPSSTFEIWKKNLEKTIELQVPHISSYALTVEPKTALQNWILNNKVQAPEEETQNQEFYFMSNFLKNEGFQHYEISNFAKPGFHSKHNTAYWQYQEYLGIGPSAHSYNGKNTRSWNVANNTNYLKKMQENQLPKETELLSEKEQFNEMMMIGLRTKWGVNLKKLEELCSEEILKKSEKEMQKKIQEGFLVIEDHYLKIPERNWFLADGIAADLFVL